MKTNRLDPQLQTDVERALVQLVLSAFPLVNGDVAARVQVAEWTQFARAAEEHGLAPLVYKSLQRLDQLDQVPPDLVERFRASYLRSSVANWIAHEWISGLLDSFERDGIPLILLKGCALGSILYGDPALRPLGDIDVLVRRADAPRARLLLRDQGFEDWSGLAERFEFPYAIEEAFRRPGLRRLRLELHTHLLGNPYWIARVDVDWFWQRSVDAIINGRAACIFAPEAQLLYLCAHFVYLHGARRLIWSYDLALLLAQRAEEMNWDELIEAAERFGLTQALKLGLARASEIWGATIPPKISARLAAVRPSMLERLLLREVDAPNSEVKLLFFALLSPLSVHQRVQYLWRMLFPSPAYIRERYHVRTGWLLPVVYLRRAWIGIRGSLRSTMSILTKP